MSQRIAIIPPELEAVAQAYQYSPGILVGKNLTIGGLLGMREDLSLPTDPEEQFIQLFENCRLILEEAGGTFDNLVSMTTYNVPEFYSSDLSDIFERVKMNYLVEPYPSWAGVMVPAIADECYCEMVAYAVLT